MRGIGAGGTAGGKSTLLIRLQRIMIKPSEKSEGFIINVPETGAPACLSTGQCMGRQETGTRVRAQVFETSLPAGAQASAAAGRRGVFA